MKYRVGFVSNSSSSSFLCDVCGNMQSGWDMCLDEAGMSECVNGHTIDDDHRLEDVDMEAIKADLRETFKDPHHYEVTDDMDEERKARHEQWNQEAIAENRETLAAIDAYQGDDIDEFLCEIWNGDERHNLPAACCPLCSLAVVSDSTLMRFLLHQQGTSRDDAVSAIQSRFSSLTALDKHLEENQ